MVRCPQRGRPPSVTLPRPLLKPSKRLGSLDLVGRQKLTRRPGTGRGGLLFGSGAGENLRRLPHLRQPPRGVDLCTTTGDASPSLGSQAALALHAPVAKKALRLMVAGAALRWRRRS